MELQVAIADSMATVQFIDIFWVTACCYYNQQVLHMLVVTAVYTVLTVSVLEEL